MARDGKPTRDRILAESKGLIFKNGFSGTSIDQILDKTGITKGAFFYHFKTKNALARVLIEDYAREDVSQLELALKETEHLKHKPLERILMFIEEFITMMQNLEEPPSCLYASYTYESSQFDDEVLEIISETMLKWRETFVQLIHNVLAKHKLNVDADVASLADQFTVIFEGAFVVSKALDDADLTAKQLQHFKHYIALLFEDR